MNTAAWEALLASRYATPEMPAVLGQAARAGAGAGTGALLALGCVRFSRRAALRHSLGVLYTYIPLRFLPTPGRRVDARTYGDLSAQLLRLAASGVGDYSAQTVVIDLEGLGEPNEKESLAEQVCPYIYEAIRSMHATLAPDWRASAHKLSTVYILGTRARGMRIYTTSVVHEEDAMQFLLKHRMFSTSAESQTGALLYDVIKTAQTIPNTPNWDSSCNDVDARVLKGALLRMVSCIEDVVVGDARHSAANRASVRTSVKSIVLEQSLRTDLGLRHKDGQQEKASDFSTEDDRPTPDTLLLSRLLLEPNYLPKLAVPGSVAVGKDVVSLRQVLGAFAIAARAPPSTPLFESEGDFVYRGRDTLGVLSSVARMAIVLLASGVEAPLCAAYLATPVSVIQELEAREPMLSTPKAIGTVGVAASGVIGENAAGIDNEPDNETDNESEEKQ